MHANFLPFKFLYLILVIDVIRRPRRSFLEHVLVSLLYHRPYEFFTTRLIGLLRLVGRGWRLRLVWCLLSRLRALCRRRRSLRVRWLLSLRCGLRLRRLLSVGSLLRIRALRIQQTSPANHGG